jgi:nucleotide-binding universal stress UspA family protein
MGYIVVGVDGAEHSKAALAWALAEARLRDAELRVVQAWHVPVASYGEYVTTDPGSEAIESASTTSLDAFLADVVGGEPDVQVTPVVVEGPPAERLLEAATGAELLVVGTRGRGGVKGLLLGSVGQQVVHHAHCPVVIVPPAGR